MKGAPSGYMLSRNMIDKIGQERHGEAWTGTIEHTARRNLTSIEQYEKDCVTPGANQSGSGMGGFVARPWTPEMRDKDRAAIYSEAYQVERLARIRYDDVLADFLQKLERGDLYAATLDDHTGRIHPVAPEFWRTRHSDNSLAKGKGPLSQTRTGALLIAEAPALPSPADGSPRSKSHGRFSREELKNWYAKRVKTWPADLKHPSEADDLSTARADIGPGVTRSAIREIRKTIAPAHWTTHGRRRTAVKPAD